jgi:hypothetical protein
MPLRQDLGNAERHAQESWRRQIISDPALPPKRPALERVLDDLMPVTC